MQIVFPALEWQTLPFFAEWVRGINDHRAVFGTWTQVSGYATDIHEISVRKTKT